MAADPDQPTLSFDPPASGGSNTSAAVRQESSSVEADVAVDQHVVRVRPDEPAIDKTFDYLVPSSMSEQIRVGTMVRIPLHGRRVGGWVVEDRVVPPSGVTLQSISKVSGWGPPPELFDLADWASWRWAGRPAALLRTASPPSVVRGLPRSPVRTPPPQPVTSNEVQDLAKEALACSVATVRLAPAVDPYPLLLAAAALGPILLAAPVASMARHLGLRLRRAGLPVAMLPDDWSLARAGWANVLGSRSAAFAPIAAPAAVIVLDEHDESFQQEQTPTWNARDVLIERARRCGIPCLLVSPTPSLEALNAGTLLTQSRSAERAGWPLFDIIDRRDEPPGSGLFSERFVQALRGDGRVVCILNRKGRSRLSSCVACGEVASCEKCAAAVIQGEDGSLVCLRCDTVRPMLCAKCGGTKMKNLRAGVNRVREELEALAREPVAEVTAERGTDAGGTGTRVVVGTEAALHRIHKADVVAFLDFDQELLAPRYRAAEEAMALLVRAARVVGPRSGGGRVLVQTRQPHHEVLQGALLAEPTRVSDAERERRQLLGYPPAKAMAVISGASAQAWVDSFVAPIGVEVLGPSDGQWIVRAATHELLCDALSAATRPGGRLRIEVDPLRF
jgi:primosomal protein N' (replication factor Y)